MYGPDRAAVVVPTVASTACFPDRRRASRPWRSGEVGGRRRARLATRLRAPSRDRSRVEPAARACRLRRVRRLGPHGADERHAFGASVRRSRRGVPARSGSFARTARTSPPSGGTSSTRSFRDAARRPPRAQARKRPASTAFDGGGARASHRAVAPGDVRRSAAGGDRARARRRADRARARRAGEAAVVEASSPHELPATTFATPSPRCHARGALPASGTISPMCRGRTTTSSIAGRDRSSSSPGTIAPCARPERPHDCSIRRRGVPLARSADRARPTARGRRRAHRRGGRRLGSHGSCATASPSPRRGCCRKTRSSRPS